MPPDLATTVCAHPLPGGAIELRLESGDGLNRLSLALLRALAEAPDAWPGAGGFVIAGQGLNFSVGADLNAIAALAGPAAWPLAREGQRWLDAIAASSRRFVAAIGGFCLGGGLDLALACHARVCTPGAYLGHHGAKLGLVTGWGGTQRLPRLLQRGRALEHLLAAEGWTAAAALEQGLVQAICPPQELLAAAAALVG
ncbi:MAG: enoyl-CoA hydratase/isomerase family protein [Terriglobales bacterium]